MTYDIAYQLCMCVCTHTHVYTHTDLSTIYVLGSMRFFLEFFPFGVFVESTTGFERECERPAFCAKAKTATVRPLATLRHRNPDTCGHAVCIRFLTAFRLLHASSRTLFLELMPKHIPNMGTLALKPFIYG